MLQEIVIPSFLNEQCDFPVYFQQDGAPAHYTVKVREWLDTQFPDIGLVVVVQWSSHPVTLT